MTGPLTPPLRAVIAGLRADAETLRRCLDERGAALLELACTRMEAAIAAADSEVLTLDQARAESGYSDRQLRQLLADGAIANAGRKGAPRIRRGDLPKKPSRATSTTYDPTSDAIALMGPRRVG